MQVRQQSPDPPTRSFGRRHWCVRRAVPRPPSDQDAACPVITVWNVGCADTLLLASGLQLPPVICGRDLTARKAAAAVSPLQNNSLRVPRHLKAHNCTQFHRHALQPTAVTRAASCSAAAPRRARPQPLSSHPRRRADARSRREVWGSAHPRLSCGRLTLLTSSAGPTASPSAVAARGICSRRSREVLGRPKERERNNVACLRSCTPASYKQARELARRVTERANLR